jgi:hypothetical protein
MTTTAERRIPTHPDWLYLLKQGIMHPDLCFLTSRAVGHLVMLASVDDCYVAGEGYLCEWHDFENKPPGHDPDRLRGEAFWSWWCRREESVQDTPEHACIAYVIAYHAWIQEHPEGP